MADLFALASLDGLWCWDLDDPDGHYLCPSMLERLGYGSGTGMTLPAWGELIFPNDRQAVLDLVQRHLADPSHPFDKVLRYAHASGETVWLRCRGRVVRDGSGRPMRVVAAHTDLTAQIAAEASAERNRMRADAAREELRAFAYALPHDLKAPVNTMHMLLGELSHRLHDQGDQVAEDLVEFGLTTVRRMELMIEDLLRYTRAVGGETGFEPVDLNAVLADAIDGLGPDIAAARADIVAGDLPLIDASPWQIRALFRNLLGNAVKFRKAGQPPRIRIEATTDPILRRAVVTVSDDGIGIDSANHQQIFAIFQKLHAEHEYQGTGIGLPLCRRIARNHRGDLHVQSRRGEGSTFTLSIPLTQS